MSMTERDPGEVEPLAERAAEGARERRQAPQGGGGVAGSAWLQSCAAAGAAVRIDSAVCRFADQIDTRSSWEPTTERGRPETRNSAASGPARKWPSRASSRPVAARA